MFCKYRKEISKANDDEGTKIAVNYSRKVLKTHSTSFFIVTRFLPKYMRDEVELVYGSVRFPDEIVDSFDIENDEKKVLLDQWRKNYHIAIQTNSFKNSVNAGVPVLLAGFAEVVKKYSIPIDYYNSFLDAMELDVKPRKFEDIDDLIDNYIFGSAIVVGAISLQIIKRLEAKSISGDLINPADKKFNKKGNLIGGIIFGCGWALTGACPGPLYALVGSGYGIILVSIFSAMLGVVAYGILRDKLPH